MRDPQTVELRREAPKRHLLGLEPNPPGLEPRIAGARRDRAAAEEREQRSGAQTRSFSITGVTDTT
jgi:hypothetical protein